jgi:hypothetical protein
MRKGEICIEAVENDTDFTSSPLVRLTTVLILRCEAIAEPRRTHFLHCRAIFQVLSDLSNGL